MKFGLSQVKKPIPKKIARASEILSTASQVLSASDVVMGSKWGAIAFIGVSLASKIISTLFGEE